jgi:hypothetical protein
MHFLFIDDVEANSRLMAAKYAVCGFETSTFHDFTDLGPTSLPVSPDFEVCARKTLANDLAATLAEPPPDYVVLDYHLKNGSTARDVVNLIWGQQNNWHHVEIFVHSSAPQTISAADAAFFSQRGIRVFKKTDTLFEKALIGAIADRFSHVRRWLNLTP